MKLFIPNSFKANPTPKRENITFKASSKENLEKIQRLATQSIAILGIDADGFEPSAKAIAVKLGLVVEEARLKTTNNVDLEEALIKAREAVNELKRKLGIPVFNSLKS